MPNNKSTQEAGTNTLADLFSTLWGFTQSLFPKPSSVTQQGETTASQYTSTPELMPLAKSGGTSLSGTPSTATPSIANWARVGEYLDRQSTITDAWQLYFGDYRVRRALSKRAMSAVKGGWKFRAKPKDGVGVKVARRAMSEIDAMFRRTGLVLPDGTPNKLALCELMVKALVEGDMFLQREWNDDGDILAVLSMPAISMVRLTDNADRFVDFSAAFGQVDVNQQSVHTTFTKRQIYHGRLNHIPGDRYGNSELLQARTEARDVRTLERSQYVRRIVRSAPIDQYSFGDKENVQEWDDVRKAAAEVGINEAYAAAASNPYRQAQVIVDNGLLTIHRHEADAAVHEIADIIYRRDGLMLALGTPLQVMGYGLENMQRDTLEMIVEQWLEDLEFDVLFMMSALWDLIELQLRLKHINPDSLKMQLTPMLNTLGTAQDKANFVKTLSQNTMGAGQYAKPMPLITTRKACELFAPELGIEDDVDEYVNELESEAEEFHVDPDTVEEHTEDQLSGGEAPQGAAVGSANSKNQPGGAKTGYGSRFEGGKAKDSRDRKPGEGYKK